MVWCLTGGTSQPSFRFPERLGKLPSDSPELRPLGMGQRIASGASSPGQSGRECLADFESIWDVLTPQNRGRLLRAVVQSVEVDEPANRVKVFLAELRDAPSADPERCEVLTWT